MIRAGKGSNQIYHERDVVLYRVIKNKFVAGFFFYSGSFSILHIEKTAWIMSCKK